MSVFHIKYRPQKIADLDLSSVSVNLINILKSKNIPQSLLFAGPKGAGKTSAARIFARAINCSDKVGVEPCGICENCKEIQKGSCLDVMEIDAASNRGIEEARDLKEKAYLSPSKLDNKVIIIDEVHMMTRDAFNALLKLIEEPPKNTYFILCTTDENKIPDTVLSRLIKVSFYKGDKDELKKSLRRVVDGEKVIIDEEALDMIVEKSDGSFRNLQKTFNEICLDFGETLTKKEIELYFIKRTGEYAGAELEEDLIVGEKSIILAKIEKMAGKGINFKEYREELLKYFQDKMLGNCGVEGKETSTMSVVQLEKWLQLLIVAGKQEKDVSIDQLPLELAVVEFLNSNNQITSIPNNIQLPNKNDKNEVEEKTSMASSVDLGIGVEEVEQNWAKVLVAVKPFNHSVEAFLRAARPKSLEGNKLTLEVFYPFHKDKLDEQKNRKIVEEGLQIVLGKQMVLECILSTNKRESLVIKNDTPDALVNEKLSEDKPANGDIYDVAKEIFG